MTRKEYLETIEGQLQEQKKRWITKNYLTIQQEPKSKNSISHEEKKIFRQEIKRQLKERKRRAHIGKIVLQIDFYTTQNNPPALHTLSKNYLDLLHKDIKEDNLGGLLFKDDGQIKILICNYHINISREQNPEIRITSYSLSNFIKDIELINRIYTNNFDNEDSFMHRRFLHETELEENLFDICDFRVDLKNLDKKKEENIRQYGQEIYEIQRHNLIRKIQEKYLKQNEIGIRDWTSIFQNQFSHNKKYSSDESFQNIWNINSSYIFLTSDFVGLGKAPAKKGETKIFKKKLKDLLNSFKKKHEVLFPLLHSVFVTVTFISPKCNILDLDNLARYIVPFINEIFLPPAKNTHSFNNKYLTQLLKKEVNFEQKFLPNSIVGYQIIDIPRKEDDPEDGKIDFIITDGLGAKSNVWNLIHDTIEKWKKGF